MKKYLSILRFVIISLFCIEVLWLVLGNFFLNTSYAYQLANLKSEKFSINWENARTFYPTQIHAEKLDITIRTSTTDITIEADEVDARIHLLPLMFKHLIVDNVKGSLQSVILNRNGLKRKNLNTAASKPGFPIEIRNMEVDHIDSFAFNDFVIRGGQAQANGTFIFKIGGDSNVENLNLNWLDASIQSGNKVFSDTVNVAFLGGISAFNPRVDKGVALFEKVSGQFELAGAVSSLSPLKVLFADTKWVESIDGEGVVDIKLAFDEGKLLPGSVFDIDATGLSLDFLGFRASGVGRVDGYVTDLKGNQESRVIIVFDQFAMARHDALKPLVLGEGLMLGLKAPELGSGLGLEDVEIVLDIPESSFPDIISTLSRLNCRVQRMPGVSQQDAACNQWPS